MYLPRTRPRAAPGRAARVSRALQGTVAPVVLHSSCCARRRQGSTVLVAASFQCRAQRVDSVLLRADSCFPMFIYLGGKDITKTCPCILFGCKRRQLSTTVISLPSASTVRQPCICCTNRYRARGLLISQVSRSIQVVGTLISEAILGPCIRNAYPREVRAESICSCTHNDCIVLCSH